MESDNIPNTSKIPTQKPSSSTATKNKNKKSPKSVSKKSSNKSASNSKQSGRASRLSDHGSQSQNERRERYPSTNKHNNRYSAHNNQNRGRSRYEYPNRHFDRRPNRGWNSSGNRYGHRVWQRPQPNYSNNKHFENPHFQNVPPIDLFRNFQQQNFGQFQNVSFENPNIPNCELRGSESSNQNEKVAFNNPEPFTNQNQELAFNAPDQTNEYSEKESLTNQNQEIAFRENEQTNEYCQPNAFSNVILPDTTDHSSDDLLLNIKTEFPEPEFSLENCINTDNRTPSISVIPISRLIKSELQDLNRADIIAPTTPNKKKRSLKPNLVQRKKRLTKNGSLSENLVQRVANMDKVGIKNVINSSGTKYDAALKIQARKRLREEIRKQLKSMNFTPQEGNENSVIIPDEIVDSMNIPAVVLDEIRKAFGIVLLEDLQTKLIEQANKSDSTTSSNVTSNSASALTTASAAIPAPETAPVQSPTSAQTKALTPAPTKAITPAPTKAITPAPNKAITPAPTKALTPSPSSTRMPAPTPTLTPTPTTPSTETVQHSNESSPKSPDLKSKLQMLNERTSQSGKITPPKVDKRRRSQSTEPILIIDSSSSSSSCSSSSSDSDTSSTSSGSHCSNSSSFKRRRRRKRILEANVVGNFEKLILPNLTLSQRTRYKEKYSKTTKSSLLYIYGICAKQAKHSFFEQKEKLKIKRNLSSADNAQALEFLMKAILNLFEKQKETMRKNKAAIYSTRSRNSVSCNQGNSDDDIDASRKRRESSSSVKSQKHQSPNKLDKPSSKSSTKSANSSQRVSSDESDSESDTEEIVNEEPPSRLWKSPGEKKCIEIESTPPLSNLVTMSSPIKVDTISPFSSLGMMQPPLANYSFDIDSLKQNSIGDEAVSSIREIDVKLVELHKRKMYIEEMILKLQKDKMEVDLWSMKLQNEKYILLNSALASTSTSCSVPMMPTVVIPTQVIPPTSVTPAQETTSAVKRKILPTTPEKLKNRKKRIIPLKVNAINGTKTTKAVMAEVLKSRKAKQRAISSKSEEGSEKNATSTKKGKDRVNTETKKVSSSESEKSSETTSATKTKSEPKQEEVIRIEVPQFDYSGVKNGSLDGWKLPITQIIVIRDAIIAASEDGNIYKFNIKTRVLESKFSKHTEAITQIFNCPKESFIYTTSLDGFLKKTSIENFGLEIQSLNLQEPLQSIDIEWSTAFIGSRWGNIFTYDIKKNSLNESLLCSSKSSIIAIKATKEGPRKILIVSSKGNQINFRDAMTGLLLRSLDIPENLHIYSILMDDGSVYCGTQRNEIYQYNFTTGVRLAIFNCGNGAVSMKLYKDKYIFVGCYDGFVYILNKVTGCQIGRFPGSGKMILALEIAGDKLITSAKDNTMQIVDIPKYIVNLTREKS